MRVIIACIAIFIALYFLFKRVAMENIRNVMSKTIDTRALYGVDNTEQVRAVARAVSYNLAMGANPDTLYKWLLEVGNQESKLGTVRYKDNRGFGYGVWQFDKIAWQDVLNILKSNKSLTNDINTKFNKDILKTSYDMLKTDIYCAAIFARVFTYYRVKGAIGETINKRAQQWKTYYNSVLGAGTVEKYLRTNATLKY